ncbi:MAG: ATP-dependent helicase, partial [Methylococcaceae bacterium]
MAVNANIHQQQAINLTDGAVLIIAGPGSGKTFTLVERILNLIQNHQVLPENLLVVTFTEKAAMELRTRVSNRLLELDIPFNVNEMYLGTFHSVCLKIIEDNREYTRLNRSFTLMDQFDQQYFFFQKLREFHEIENVHFITGTLEKTPAWIQSENLVKWINKVSEEVLPIDELCESGDQALTALGECYKKYSQLLEENNALDFSTIQVVALRLLQDNAEVLQKMQSQLEYLMVDEYQDTNTIQEKILMLLTGDKKNICVVGDDDQALYRFRGATVRNILQFPDNFPDQKCKQISLTTNYRSHPDIIRFYNHWMSEHHWTINDVSYRYEKIIEAPKADFPDCITAVKAIAEEHEDWHDEIYNLLTHLKEQGQLEDWNQVAFLFQSVKNKKVQALARSLEEKGIPVYSPRGNLFFEREEICLLIGALITIFPSYAADQDKLKTDGRSMSIWEYYESQCVTPFLAEIVKPEHESLRLWCKRKAEDHISLIRNTDYAFTSLFYELLQFPLFSRY